MEVTAPVRLIKFKRRKVSAIRDYPKGCGRNLPEQVTITPPASSKPDVVVSKPDVPNGVLVPSPSPPVSISVSPDQEDSKRDIVESEAAKPVHEEVPNSLVTPTPGVLLNGGSDQPELAKESLDQTEFSKVGLDQPELAKGGSDVLEVLDGGLEQLELPKESVDQGSVQIAAATAKININQWCSKQYPPPKRRRISATRDYPVGCGKGRGGKFEVAPSAVTDKEHVVNQQVVAEGSVEVKHTEKDTVEVKKVEIKQTSEVLTENDGEVRVKSPSASVKIKSSDVDKTKSAVKQLGLTDGSDTAVSTEKSRSEARWNDVNQIREKDREIRSEARVKSVSKSSLVDNCVEESNEKKILVRSGSEKKLEGHGPKQAGKSLPVNERRESKPTLDSRSQSGSKLVVKQSSHSEGKPLVKRLVKNPTDAKVLKRKFTEEIESEVFVDEIEGGGALQVYDERFIVQALMAAPNCPWRQGRKSTGVSNRSATPKTLKKEGKSSGKKSAFKATPVSRLKSELASEDEEDSVLQDEENEMALTVYKKPEENEYALTVYKRDLSVTVTPVVPSKPNYKGDNDNVSDRSKVKNALRIFQVVCRKLLQGEESKSKKDLGRMKRVDLDAAGILKRNKQYVNSGAAILGHVRGVEVGDEFHYRVELSIVGLHRPFQGGIDSMKKGGMLLATSIVASGGYHDDMDSSDVLIYSGSGGTSVGGQPGDQKLERGNLALKNCIDAKTPVRVIHGSKEPKGSKHDSKSKVVSTFTYNGLYVVENYWTEKGPHGFSVFKFQLRRMAGQPELVVKEVKRSKKSIVREGLCVKDISGGKESMAICAVNTVDDDLPMPFKYVIENIYPSGYAHTPPSGCDCRDGCSDSEKCACAVKNGGDIPFNYNGSIVQAKPLVYECGPSCKCHSSCHNRVSQHGIKIPLEIFKTQSRGWGVRSLCSIPSGSFICEYVGELLKDSDAELRSNDEYLFDIGHNYEDKKLWEGLPSFIPGLQSSSTYEKVEDVGFTIDAAEYGNIGRFINHSCSPNLYAQNVLYDHDDKRMPHIMFFAADNIPPLQELTYHYNYTVDEVRDLEGNIKQKKCYCGAPECTGRLY